MLAVALFAALGPAVALGATGSISGTVVDAGDKAAIEGVEACAAELSEERDFGCAETDAAGFYEIEDLDPGEYAVDFWPGELSYRYQAYDEKSSWSEADPVVVGIGETSGIDAELQPTAAIQGTVTATEDGLPVGEVEVCAYEAASEELFDCDYTAGDGTYSIDRLVGGQYKVTFWSGPSDRHLARQFYDRRNRWPEADVVSVAEGETTQGVDADLPPGAVIAGGVARTDNGQPLDDIRVCGIEVLANELSICTWTNEQGHYAIRRFPQGTYKVAFSLDLGEWFWAAPSENDGFPTEFWNEQTTLAAANPILLATAAVAKDIDARLGPVAPAAPSAAVPPASASPPRPPVRRKCRRGFRKKLVRGKRRCVRVHRRHRHRRRRDGGRRARRSSTVFRAERRDAAVLSR